MASQSLEESLVLVPAQPSVSAQEKPHKVSLLCILAGGHGQTLVRGQAAPSLLSFEGLTVAFCSCPARDLLVHLQRTATKRRAEAIWKFALVGARCGVLAQTWQWTMVRRQKANQKMRSGGARAAGTSRRQTRANCQIEAEIGMTAARPHPTETKT